MDEVSKYRLTGAIVWLMLLVFLVPIWFGEPVNFKPTVYVAPEKIAEHPTINQVSALPKEALPVVKSASTQSVPEKNKEPEESQISPPPTTQWIVRIIAYKNIQDANELLGRLEVDYEVMIKSFEKSGMHSVRVGPYSSKAKAEQVRQKLDKMLHTQAEVVRLK